MKSAVLIQKINTGAREDIYALELHSACLWRSAWLLKKNLKLDNKSSKYSLAIVIQ